MLNISKDEKRYSEIELDLHKKLAYEKGRASIIEELEKIRAEVGEPNEMDYFENSNVWQKWFCNLIDKHISELKGE